MVNIHPFPEVVRNVATVGELGRLSCRLHMRRLPRLEKRRSRTKLGFRCEIYKTGGRDYRNPVTPKNAQNQDTKQRWTGMMLHFRKKGNPTMMKQPTM